MRRWLIALVALVTLGAAGAWAYARSNSAANCCSGGSTIVCPLTGEEIAPCCCPLRK